MLKRDKFLLFNILLLLMILNSPGVSVWHNACIITNETREAVCTTAVFFADVLYMIVFESIYMTAKTIKHSGNGNSTSNGCSTRINRNGNGHKGMELMAKTLFRDLKSSGYDLGQILDFSGKLIEFVNEEIAAPEN